MCILVSVWPAGPRAPAEHAGDTLKIKAGLVDLEYIIGGEPLPTSFMGFEFTDGCAWHSDGQSLVQTKVRTFVYCQLLRLKL